MIYLLRRLSLSTIIFVLYVFTLGGGLSAADFREKSLPEEKKAELDALILQLGDDSWQNREQAGRAILKYGTLASEALKEAQNNSDYTIAESATYYFRFLNQNLIRIDDSEKVRKALTSYTSLPQKNRWIALFQLMQLPSEEALTPLLRIVLHEKDALLSRMAALTVFWALPHQTPYPNWPCIALEANSYPDAEIWKAKNAQNHEERRKIEAEIQEYLVSEPSQTEGKRFLLELLDAERALYLVEGIDPNKVALSEPMVSQLEMMKSMMALLSKIEKEVERKPTPEMVMFLKEYTYLMMDILYQTGHDVEAGMVLRQISTKLARFSTCKTEDTTERIGALYHRNQFLQFLAVRGYWDACAVEISQLVPELQPHEKRLYIPFFTNVLRTVGKYNLAIELLLESRKLNFLNMDEEDEEVKKKTSMITARTNYFRILMAYQKSDVLATKQAIESALKEKEIDVDALIFTRFYALEQNDSELLQQVETQINLKLDDLKKKIENPSVTTDERVSQYNEFAWLACRTERRLDEALTFTNLAIEFDMGSEIANAGLKDTLAHVYFAQGELELAIETQKKAVEIAPYELDIIRNLQKFQSINKK